MPLARGIAGEMVRALLVLALLFLNFGHASMASAASAGFLPLDSGILCGESQPGAPKNLDGDPCPACRIAAGIDLPPAPCTVIPAYGALAPVSYAAWTIVPARDRDAFVAGPRAPPAA